MGAEDKHKAEARSSQVPRLLQATKIAAMGAVVEITRTFTALRLEQVDQNGPRVEDLRDLTSLEDIEVDPFTGVIDLQPDRGTGILKVKAGKSMVSLPVTPEELRLMHRRIGTSWQMIASKHSN